ncbi:MAG: phage head closure protein [Acidovorax sp.]
MLQAGKLDKRVKLREPQIGKGTSGGIKAQWIDHPEMWASVRNLSGDEKPASSAAGGQTGMARTEITISYRPAVAAGWAVLYDGKLYIVKHVNDVMERHERLILTCDTGARNG